MSNLGYLRFFGSMLLMVFIGIVVVNLTDQAASTPSQSPETNAQSKLWPQPATEHARVNSVAAAPELQSASPVVATTATLPTATLPRVAEPKAAEPTPELNGMGQPGTLSTHGSTPMNMNGAMGSLMGQPLPNYAAMECTDGETIYKLLTSHVWTNWGPNRQSDPFCGVGDREYLLKLYANGGYDRYPVNEPSESGRWNLQVGPRQSFFVCFDNGMRKRVKLYEKNIIQLDEQYMFPKERLEAPADAKNYANVAPLVLSQLAEDKQTILTSRTWYRANDLNTDRFPAQIQFLNDHTFVAHSIDGREYPLGTWYASTTSALATGPNDPQGESYSLKNYGARLPIKIVSREKLDIDGTAYVAKERLSDRGEIWLGHDHPRVRIEYPMPIRRGVPCRFDVHFVNLPTVKLQRFSVTKNFEHNYRKPGGELAEVSELSAIDLNNYVVPAYQSKSVSLEVTFPESGIQQYYFNAMMADATQIWDIRTGLTLRILEP